MKPTVKSDDDFSNFDKEFVDEEVQDTPAEPIKDIKNVNYEGFTYAGPKLERNDSDGKFN